MNRSTGKTSEQDVHPPIQRLPGMSFSALRFFVQGTIVLFLLVSAVLLCFQMRAVAATTLDTSQDYKIVNQHSGLVLGISSASQTAGASAVQWTDNGTSDHLWHFIPNGGGYYKIENMNSGEILGVSGASKTAGAAVVQWGDNGTADHLWQFVAASGGYYKIVNQNSGLVLGVSNASTASGAGVLQWTDTGASDHLWSLLAAGAAYVGPGAISGTTTIHDPSMVKTTSGTYYAFSTTLSGTGLQMRSSTDRVHFTDAGKVFTTNPSWTNTYNGGNGVLWAPDVSYHNGKYWLYYAVSTFGSQNSAIGLATSTTAAPGSWSDQGIVYTSSSSNDYNAIDPALVVDTSGNWWLSLGSFWTGIKLIQINPATGKQLASNQTRYSIAQRTPSTAIEASYIYPHGGYYYLFASFDTCCQGTNSTYHIIVGRASSVTGPYTDRGGLSLMQGGGTILLSTHSNIVGPGGQTVMHDTDGDLLVYHYYDGNHNGTATLGLNLLGWDSAGWPYVR